MTSVSHGHAVRLLLCAALLPATAGCAWIGDAIGAGKQPPDEFVVVNRRPLVVPPDFQLRPPEPGKSETQEIQPSRQVVAALFPGQTEVPPRPSPAESALLAEVGEQVGSADPDARSNAGDKTQIVHKGTMLAELLKMEPRRLRSDGATIEHRGSDEKNNRTSEKSRGFFSFSWLLGNDDADN